MSGVRKTLALISLIGTYAGMALLVAAVAITCANVILRYVFLKPLAWGEELAVLMQFWFVFLPLGWVELRNDHLNLSVVPEGILGERWRKLLRAAKSLVTVAVSLAVAYYGLAVVLKNYEFAGRTLTLGVPLWLVFLILPASFTLVALIRLADPLMGGTKELDR